MSGGGGGVRPDERAMKQRTRRTGVFLLLQASDTSHVIYTGPAGVDKLTVNVRNFTVLADVSRQ